MSGSEGLRVSLEHAELCSAKIYLSCRVQIQRLLAFPEPQVANASSTQAEAAVARSRSTPEVKIFVSSSTLYSFSRNHVIRKRLQLTANDATTAPTR